MVEGGDLFCFDSLLCGGAVCMMSFASAREDGTDWNRRKQILSPFSVLCHAWQYRGLRKGQIIVPGLQLSL